MAQGTMTNITAMLSQSELDIVNIKVLKNLKHTSLGIMSSASPDNPKVVAGGGTANFKVQKYLQSAEYTSANRNNSGDIVKQELKVKIDIEKAIKVHYEIETLELDGLDFASRSAYISHIQGGIQLTLTALMDAYMIKLAVEAAAANKTTNEIINSKFLLETEMTAAEREAAYLQIADAKIDIAKQVTRYNIGSNPNDYSTFLFQKLTNRLLLAMPKGGDSATQVGRELSGMEGITRIAGLGTVKDHLFLGKKIDAGSAFSKDENFDFSKVAGATIHNEALFLATQGMQTVAASDPNSGNQKYITKFNLFRGPVRPELVAVYRTVASPDTRK